MPTGHFESSRSFVAAQMSEREKMLSALAAKALLAEPTSRAGSVTTSEGFDGRGKPKTLALIADAVAITIVSETARSHMNSDATLCPALRTRKLS